MSLSARTLRDQRKNEMSSTLHPLFQGVLTQAADRQALLARVARIDARRFTGEPPTGFGDLCERGSDRWLEIREKHDDREERLGRDPRNEMDE